MAQDIRRPGSGVGLASTLTPRSGSSKLPCLASSASKDKSLSSHSAWETEVPLPLQEAVKILSYFIHFTTHVFPQRGLVLTYKTDKTFAIDIFS